MSERTIRADDEQDDDLAALRAAFPQERVRATLDAPADYVVAIEYEADNGEPVLSRMEFEAMRAAGFAVSWLSGRSLYVSRSAQEGEDR